LIEEAADMTTKSEVQYEIIEIKIGQRYFVRMTDHNGVAADKNDFASEQEAQEWIDVQKMKAAAMG
jgi:hypothetical protein